MKFLKFVLLPFAAVVEVAVLGVCWVLAACRALDTSRRLAIWAEKAFPDLNWYLESKADHDGSVAKEKSSA